jgi:molybdenum cofactor guanylyltransferase
MHKKHSDIAKADFGYFARNEISFLGTSCENLNLFFKTIIDYFPEKRFSIIEADHKADENIELTAKYIDKINFQRLDFQLNNNIYDKRNYFENTDLTLINGNHFEGKNQVIFLDSKKSLEKKLEKLTNVMLIIQKDIELPAFLNTFFGENRPPIIQFSETNKIFKFIENIISGSIPPIFGLVLSGGKSIRMGTDKAQLKYHGQQTQIEYATNLLQKHCGENVFLSINEAQQNQINNDIEIIKDVYLGIGPMGGILSAFQKHPNVAWLIIACDMPYVTENTINQLVTNRNPTKLATAFKSPENDFPEPLITIWEPKAYPKLMQMLAYGIDCPRKTLINSDIELLINNEPKELQNINTVEAFQKAILDLSPKIA